MGKLINKQEFIKKKNEVLILSIILSIVMFFIIGNLRMIYICNRDISQLNSGKVSDGLFSVSYVSALFIYIICCTTIGIILRDKDNTLINLVNNINKKQIFFTKLALGLVPIIIALVFNLIIKTVLYFIFKESILNGFGIETSSLIMFSIEVILITLLIYSISFMMNIAVKNSWIAGLIPIFILNTFVLVFGVGIFFISDKLLWIKNIFNPLESVVLGILKSLYSNEPIFNGDRLIILSVIFLSIVVIVCATYLMLYLVNDTSIKTFYPYNFMKHIFYAVLSYLIGFYMINGIGYIILISTNYQTYDSGLLTINILTTIGIIMFYMVLEVIYLYRTRKIGEIKFIDVHKEYELIYKDIFEDKILT